MDAQAKEIKNKVMCEINSFAIVYFLPSGVPEITHGFSGVRVARSLVFCSMFSR
jgi:hypothetical protein